MQNLKLYKSYLIRQLNLLCGSRAIKQFCFLDHFQINLSSSMIIDFGTQLIQALSCKMNYHFDYLDEKSIFFGETKTTELPSMGFTLWLQKTTSQFRYPIFFNQFQANSVNVEPIYQCFSINSSIFQQILMAHKGDVRLFTTAHSQ